MLSISFTMSNKSLQSKNSKRDEEKEEVKKHESKFPTNLSEACNTYLNVNNFRKYALNLYLMKNGLKSKYLDYKELETDVKEKTDNPLKYSFTGKFAQALTIYADVILKVLLNNLSVFASKHSGSSFVFANINDVRLVISDNIQLRNTFREDLEYYDENNFYMKDFDVKDRDFKNIVESVDKTLTLSDKAQNAVFYLLKRKIDKIICATFGIVEYYDTKKKQLNSRMVLASVNALHNNVNYIVEEFIKRLTESKLMAAGDEDEEDEENEDSEKMKTKSHDDDAVEEEEEEEEVVPKKNTKSKPVEKSSEKSDKKSKTPSKSHDDDAVEEEEEEEEEESSKKNTKSKTVEKQTDKKKTKSK
jgi:hypothetical protein